MASNLPSGIYNIVSAIDGNPPTGIGLALPGSSQFVYLNAPNRGWMVTKQGDIYYLGARGYPYTEVIGDQVAASTNLENNLQWVITYREGQGAYTIQAVNHEGKGWTVAGESIVIQHLTGEPGGGRELSRRQLFKFDRM